MAKLTKNRKDSLSKFDKDKLYSLEEASNIIKDFSSLKFDSSVDITVNLGVDPRKADQNVRGVVKLPNGTGKDVKVLALVTPDKEDEAKKAGADLVGLDEYIKKIQGGWTDIDVIITMPSIMGKLGPLGKVLGPRGLMPNPKTGTVTMNVAKAVSDQKSGMVELRVEKTGIVHTVCGKVSFNGEDLLENIKQIYNTLLKSRPPSVKGQFLEKISISSSMGPGVKVNINSIG